MTDRDKRCKISILDARDISNVLGIALANAYKLMKRPDFPAIQVSARRYIVPEEAFRKWLDDQAWAKGTFDQDEPMDDGIPFADAVAPGEAAYDFWADDTD